MQWGHVIQVSELAWFDRLKQAWLCGICGGSGRVRRDHYFRQEAQSSAMERQCFACDGTGKPKQVPPPPASIRPSMFVEVKA